MHKENQTWWTLLVSGAAACRKSVFPPFRLKECDMWGQSEVLRVLQRYRPQSEDELFDILSLLDSYLVSPHPPVMAATLSLFLSLCSSLPAVTKAALERVRGPLLAACGSGSREMRFTALCHIQVRGWPLIYLYFTSTLFLHCNIEYLLYSTFNYCILKIRLISP